MPTIQLKTLICINPDETDKDEIYLKLKGKKIWPKDGNYKQTDTGEKTDINIEFEHEEGQLDLELWDFDYMSMNDKLGTFTMIIDHERGLTNTASMKPHKKTTASYILEWKIKSDF